MAKKLNQPFDVPHFPPAEGHLLQGKLFTDKKTKFLTFWGPGQLRDDRWGVIISDDGGITIEGYAKNPNTYPNTYVSWYYIPPTDWRTPFSPLIPPQVVHLNIKIEYAYHNIDSLVAGKFIDGWEDVTTDYEPATVEAKRLVDIANETKKIIEKLRKGKTWVDINDYNEGSVDNGGGYNPDPEFQIFNDAGFYNDFESPYRLNMSGYDVHLFLDTPTPFEGIFFGTDFLGIYLGDNSFQPIMDHGDIIGPNTFEETPIWKIISDALPKTVNYFYNYSQILFPCDIGVVLKSTQINKVANYFAAEGTKTYEVFASVTVARLDEVPPNAVLVTKLPPLSDGSDGGYNVLLSDDPSNLFETFNVEFNEVPIQISSLIFPKVVQWGKKNKIDITQERDTSSIGSADDLVKIIAEHYNFNPETGKDIKN